MDIGQTLYENVDRYLKDKDRQTIYMHQFFMYGNYSDQYNKFTLAYLLVMEAVLDRRHVWLYLDQNTDYCQIEQYHIHIWRNRWRLNGWLNIFIDLEMNQAMVHLRDLEAGSTLSMIQQMWMNT